MLRSRIAISCLILSRNSEIVSRVAVSFCIPSSDELRVPVVIASPGSIHETGCSGLVHWDDPEGWDGEGGGRGVDVWQNQYNIVK